MVTLTRGIDMYLIGPFPRPQFFGGPRPQLLAVPRPQFSIEGCHLPFAPPGGQQSTTRTRRFERHATTPGSRSERQSATTNTGIPTTSSSPASRSRTRQPASRRAPTRPRTTTRPLPDPGTTDCLDGREEHEPGHRAPMTHGAARPSRAPARPRAAVTPEEQSTSARRTPDGRPAKLPRHVDWRQNSASHAIGEPSRRPGSPDDAEDDDEELHRRSDTHHTRPNGIQRTHFNDRHEHHESSAEGARRAAAGPDIQRDIRPLCRRWESPSMTSWSYSTFLAIGNKGPRRGADARRRRRAARVCDWRPRATRRARCFVRCWSGGGSRPCRTASGRRSGLGGGGDGAPAREH